MNEYNTLEWMLHIIKGHIEQLETFIQQHEVYLPDPVATSTIVRAQEALNLWKQHEVNIVKMLAGYAPCTSYGTQIPIC